MPDGVVRLRAEDRPHLVDALEDPDQLLLVELRALREVGRPAEVVDGKDVGTRLGRRLDELRRRDLREVETVEGRAETAERRSGQFPLRPLGGVPPQHRGVVEQGRQGDIERGAPQLRGRRHRRLGERLDRCLSDLDATGRLGVCRSPTDDTDSRLLGRHRGAGRQDDLRESAAVPDDEEGDARQLTTPVHPPLEGDARAGLGGGQG